MRGKRGLECIKVRDLVYRIVREVIRVVVVEGEEEEKEKEGEQQKSLQCDCEVDEGGQEGQGGLEL